MTPSRLSICVLLLFAVGASGCARSIYDWGTYETSVYNMYSSENHVAEKEIERLSGEIQRSMDRNRLIPPGKLAHLGFLQLQNGNHAAARANFSREKALYPESAEFMDFMLKRVPKK